MGLPVTLLSQIETQKVAETGREDTGRDKTQIHYTEANPTLPARPTSRNISHFLTETL